MIYTVFMPVTYWYGPIFGLSVMLTFGQEDLETSIKKKTLRAHIAFELYAIPSVLLSILPSVCHAF